MSPGRPAMPKCQAHLVLRASERKEKWRWCAPKEEKWRGWAATTVVLMHLDFAWMSTRLSGRSRDGMHAPKAEDDRVGQPLA